MSLARVFLTIFAELLRLRVRFAIVLIAISIVSCSIMGFGHQIKLLIDNGIANQDDRAIDVVVLRLLLITLIFSLSSILRSVNIRILSENIGHKIQSQIYQHLMSVEFGALSDSSYAVMLNKLSAGISAIKDLINDNLSLILRSSVVLVGSLIFMCVTSGLLLIAIFGVVCIALMPIMGFMRYTKQKALEAKSYKTAVETLADDSLRNLKIIRVFNRAEHYQIKFQDITAQYMRFACKTQVIRSILISSAIMCIISGIIFVLWLSAHNVYTSKLSPGGFTAFIFYTIIAILNLVNLINTFASAKTKLLAAQDMFDLMQINIIKTDDLDFKYQSNDYALEFQNVCFKGDSCVLTDINFQVKSGSVISILGRSGVGKSTIFGLTLKFLKPQSGCIKLFGQDISMLKPSSMYEVIGFVPQESHILHASIQDNITMYRECTQEWLTQVIKACNLEHLVADQSRVGIAGSKLSGGERQRVGIARGLVCKPKLLLMDEATNAMDKVLQASMLRNIREICPDTTIILITHEPNLTDDAIHIT